MRRLRGRRSRNERDTGERGGGAIDGKPHLSSLLSGATVIMRGVPARGYWLRALSGLAGDIRPLTGCGLPIAKHSREETLGFADALHFYRRRLYRL